MTTTGECFCGNIKYQVDGSLHNTKSCHCSRCRKAFGSQASVSAMLKPGEFKWLSGENQLTSFVNKQGFGIQFCNTCGSTLCSMINGEVYQVFLGCVNGDPDIKIGKHTFVGSKAKWEIIPEGVPQHQEDAPKDA